ncbi:hypothetical protein F7725_023234%2C partial [Scomber scombrus]|uniref:Uncharacterized protein n=1 Tax=Scomber scombrus TaxID=13677 RepID=A0AAV1N545_SCOSC
MLRRWMEEEEEEEVRGEEGRRTRRGGRRGGSEVKELLLQQRPRAPHGETRELSSSNGAETTPSGGISVELATWTRHMMNRRLASAQFCSPTGTQELRSPTPSLLCTSFFGVFVLPNVPSILHAGYEATGATKEEEEKHHTDHLSSLSCKIPTALHLRYIPPPLQAHTFKTKNKKTPKRNSSSVKTRKYRVKGVRSCSIIQYQACDFGGNNTDSRVVTAKVSNVRVGCVRRGSHCAVQTVGENRD